MTTTTTNHDDIVAAAQFVRTQSRDTLWAIMSGDTSADELLVAMAYAEWRFRYRPR